MKTTLTCLVAYEQYFSKNPKLLRKAGPGGNEAGGVWGAATDGKLVFTKRGMGGARR